MRQKTIGTVFVLAILLVMGRPVQGQDAQGLGPGWLSLDSSVGKVDNAIQQGQI